MEQVWYKKPARFWRQALPVGNGKIGAMLFGGKRKERIALNDTTLWSGYPKDQTNPESLRFLPRVRELIFAGKNKEADALCREKLHGAYCESYLPLGEFQIRFRAILKRRYQRMLDLSQAVHTVTADGIRREAFASFPDGVLVYRIESEHPFSMRLTAKSKLHHTVQADGGLSLLGNAPDYVAPNYLRTQRRPVRYEQGKGMSFCARAQVCANGVVIPRKKSIVIRGATQATLYLATETGFVSYDKMPQTDREIPLKACTERLEAVCDTPYEALKKRHVDDYRAIYTQQDVSLETQSCAPTDELIRQAKKGAVSPALADLFYHFGKYLTIAGSRAGGQALNLQGIWNQSVRPAWSSNYTVNINTEMNYWGVVRSGMKDCIGPYVDLVYEAMQAGRRTAQVNYGCRGFACNHNVDIWRKTAPVQGPPSYMYAPMCGIWLANELYGHFKNGQLEQYREKVLEIVREAAVFANDYLVEHEGNYVICPSASPEAEFRKDGAVCSLDYATSFEMGLVRQVFENALEIGADPSLCKEIQEKSSRLYPYQGGSTGLLEWHADYEITQKGHRHFSPLYGFYPGNVIRFGRDKQETEWVAQLFKYRIENSTQFIGWSAAWAICLAARLHDGEKALHVIESMLSHSVFYNLFDVHPPFIFQIDGNLGFVAGVNEMLLYEEDGVIELLPALPGKWTEGSARGMVVNGARLDFKWQGGMVTQLDADKPVFVRRAKLSGSCRCSKNIIILD